MYSIGQLAKISSITVRTLRYYDEIGLLTPGSKTSGGHRLYTDQDITRLHHIITLKDLGLELEAINQVIKNKQSDLRETLNFRLEKINFEREQLNKAEQSIHSILELMSLEGTSSWEDVFQTFNSHPTTKKELEAIWSQHFTQEEQQVLAHLPSFGDGSELTEKWIALVNDVHKNIEGNVEAENAKALAQRWISLVEEMYKGDHELAQKAWQLTKTSDENLGFYQFDKEVVKFIEDAINYHFSHNGGRK
ncbi:MerR family transcriptional regulator [Jeotgalibacillus terrae]|uniref:MerR family transcriptional regulator n=1 Tax=Jeotgalibacillus terrae TaxID=587735 RepID=A0ABW5ZKQ5_9BACL|nr:MerR family transcriptional regulator [Jeotgalibacillus terrae]MBM7581048.1 DNA-binding transcriptional MerR regulator [Jeotgalibacillus terrae]